jgi:predicted nucleic acid-binding protein
MTRIILDTGPLVAYLCKADHHHAWATEQFKRFQPPFWTCEPVLTEAAFLLGRFGGSQNADSLLKLLSSKALRIDFVLADESPRILQLTQ